MILDYKLVYPTGSAIAGIVNSFHTPRGGRDGEAAGARPREDSGWQLQLGRLPVALHGRPWLWLPGLPSLRTERLQATILL
jgi:hypothetical protein